MDDPLNPKITLIADCHTCGEKLLYGQEKCPYCGILLDQEEIFPSVILNFVITQAVSSANTIRTFDFAVLFLLGVGVYNSFLNEEFLLRIQLITSAVYLYPIILILRWFYKYRMLSSSDPDFNFSKKEMRSCLLLWIGAHFLNGLLIYINLGKFEGK